MARFKGWEYFNPTEPKKNPENQLRGLLNRNVGENFEELIKISCEQYFRKGLAKVEKTPEPFKVIGGKHKNCNGYWVFEGFFISPAQPDFKGTVKGGRAIVFEAKSIQGDQIKQSAVTEYQEKALEDHYSMGALAFVYVYSAQRHECYRVPWTHWRDMKAIYGRKYITLEELRRFKIPERNGIILLFDEVKI